MIILLVFTKFFSPEGMVFPTYNNNNFISHKLTLQHNIAILYFKRWRLCITHFLASICYSILWLVCVSRMQPRWGLVTSRPRQQTASQHLFCSLEDIFHVMKQYMMRCHMKAKTTRRKHRHPGSSSQCSLVMSIEPVLDVSLWRPHYLSSHVNALILKYYLYYFILNYFALIYSFVRWGHVLIWFWNYIVSGLYYLFSKEKKD